MNDQKFIGVMKPGNVIEMTPSSGKIEVQLMPPQQSVPPKYQWGLKDIFWPALLLAILWYLAGGWEIF